MKPGDLVKRKGREWYALVLGFRKDAAGNRLPPGDTNYPIVMWGMSGSALIESCHRSLLEMVNESR
jgi:hypothetical protein